MPSIWYEVFSVVAIEAMSMGIPLIASNIGGLAEVFEHERSGIYVPPGDSGALAEAMRRLWNDPAACHKMGAAAREQVHDNYTPGAFLERLTAAFQRVLEQRRDRGRSIRHDRGMSSKRERGMTLLSANDEVETVRGGPESLRIAVVGLRGVPSNYSGVERIVEDLFEIIAAEGHRVTIYCRPQVLDSPTAMYKGMRLVRVAAPGGKNFETLSHSLLSTVHLLAHGDVHEGGERFDVISYHTIAPGLFAPLAKLGGIPVVNHVHGLDWQREKWRGLGSRVLRQCERTMVKNATRIVGVNLDIIEYYRANYGVEALLLPNGVHEVRDDFKPDATVLKRFGLAPRGYAVSISRLVPEKRMHDTDRGVREAPGDFKLVFVGEGKHSPEYVQRVREQAAADPRIVFTGLQQGNALETLFRCCAILCDGVGIGGVAFLAAGIYGTADSRDRQRYHAAPATAG